MKVLITGANGQLGWELQRVRPADWEVIALNRAELDITNSSEIVAHIAKHDPDLVVNAAAYTDVDKAESEKDTAYGVNSYGAENVAKALVNTRARLIHISTDFIFDGTKSQPYMPADKPNPINIYGAAKLQGEQAILAVAGSRALILRTSWIYSSHGGNFVKTMLKLMAARDGINVVADQVGTPTWARDLAKAIYHFATLPNLLGIYHWTDAGVASWYDFAVAIQEEAHQLGLLQSLIPVQPIRTENYPTPAMRPPYTILDKTATWEKLGYIAQHWRRSLRQMLGEMRQKGLRSKDSG